MHLLYFLMTSVGGVGGHAQYLRQSLGCKNVGSLEVGQRIMSTAAVASTSRQIVLARETERTLLADGGFFRPGEMLSLSLTDVNITGSLEWGFEVVRRAANSGGPGVPHDPLAPRGEPAWILSR
jgi:hypothetical protein